jgi:hypothetical protein
MIGTIRAQNHNFVEVIVVGGSFGAVGVEDG